MLHHHPGMRALELQGAPPHPTTYSLGCYTLRVKGRELKEFLLIDLDNAFQDEVRTRGRAYVGVV